MQILLTEVEYEALMNSNSNFHEKEYETMVDLCRTVADYMPIFFWNNTEPKPWGCIISSAGDEWYCDECPVIKVCPYKDKCYSK